MLFPVSSVATFILGLRLLTATIERMGLRLFGFLRASGGFSKVRNLDSSVSFVFIVTSVLEFCSIPQSSLERD